MLRRALRRVLPFALRWRIRSVRRRVGDVVSRTDFAAKRSRLAGQLSCVVCRYERPLTCYAGQESQFAAKRKNIELSLAALDGVVVTPGQTLSFWRLVGRPVSRQGYLVAAALKGGRLGADVGGAICFTSTLLYNAGLMSGMTIVERRCHSVDTYGEMRYFELGRDAAVEFAYRPSNA